MPELATPQFWIAVVEIIFVNILLSGDNAVVIVGSQIIMRLIARFPVLVLAGGGLLGYIAGEMVIEDPALQSWIAANAAGVAWIVPPLGFAAVVAMGLWLTRRRRRAVPH